MGPGSEEKRPPLLRLSPRLPRLGALLRPLGLQRPTDRAAGGDPPAPPLREDREGGRPDERASLPREGDGFAWLDERASRRGEALPWYAPSSMNLPNAISSVRILLVPAFAWLHWEGRPLAAMLVFGGAALSDGLDGFLARRFDQRTRLGAVLDPVADKCLTITGLLLLAQAGAVPLWLLGAALQRDGVVLGLSLSSRSRQRLEPAPTRVSKAATFALMSSIVLALGTLALPDLEALQHLLLGVGGLAAGLLVVASLQYLQRLRDPA